MAEMKAVPEPRDAPKTAIQEAAKGVLDGSSTVEWGTTLSENVLSLKGGFYVQGLRFRRE
jgi:hypothetical protein